MRDVGRGQHMVRVWGRGHGVHAGQPWRSCVWHSVTHGWSRGRRIEDGESVLRSGTGSTPFEDGGPFRAQYRFGAAICCVRIEAQNSYLLCVHKLEEHPSQSRVSPGNHPQKAMLP